MTHRSSRRTTSHTSVASFMAPQSARNCPLRLKDIEAGILSGMEFSSSFCGFLQRTDELVRPTFQINTQLSVLNQYATKGGSLDDMTPWSRPGSRSGHWI